jgi:nitrate reductase delta subunit
MSMKLFSPPPPRMARSLRALAWLLRYPDGTLRAALAELRAALAGEGALSAARLAGIDRLIGHIEASAPLAVEAEYVELFDRGRRAALHLFEHVHGDSRDRGPAMVDLAQTYARAGLILAPGELPDYLPVVLEFASTQPPAQARAFLGETAHIVRAIHTVLAERSSPWSAVPAAILDLAGEPAGRVALTQEQSREPDVDEAWAEPPAFGGEPCPPRRPAGPQPIRIVRPNRAASRADQQETAS